MNSFEAEQVLVNEFCCKKKTGGNTVFSHAFFYASLLSKVVSAHAQFASFLPTSISPSLC